MTRLQYLLISLLTSAGVFTIVSAFLPSASSYSHQNVLEEYFVSRTSWDIAFGVLAGCLLFTAAGYVWLSAVGVFPKRAGAPREILDVAVPTALLLVILLVTMTGIMR